MAAGRRKRAVDEVEPEKEKKELAVESIMKTILPSLVKFLFCYSSILHTEDLLHNIFYVYPYNDATYAYIFQNVIAQARIGKISINCTLLEVCKTNQHLV